MTIHILWGRAAPSIIESVDLEKSLLRKVGEAISRFRMIRNGDRVAVALSGGKDSATLLEALLLLQKRAPIEFSVCAFTVEQGKFLRPIEPLAEYLKQRGVAWTYYRDAPSLRLLEEQPGHGCDLCEALLRNTMFTGRLSALPAVTQSRSREYRLIRPLVFVTEDITRAYAEHCGVPVVPCGCSQKTGTVRRSLRDMFAALEQDYPHLKENILSAMGNVDGSRLLDPRFLDLEDAQPETPFPILTES